MENKKSPEIDAVIAWVDGSDPELISRILKCPKLVNEFLSLTRKERKTWNKLALELEIDKGSFKNKKYIDWVKWIAELAIHGLQQRDLGEEKYFIDYYQNIIDNGPLSLQIQDSFMLSKKPLENFIFD